MTWKPTLRSLRVLFDRYTPLIVGVLAGLCLAALVATYVNDQNDRERDRALGEANAARLEDNARLLGCFDDFATNLAGGLPLVRAAGAVRDSTLQAALTGLAAVLRKAVSGGRVTTEDTAALLDKFEAYERAARRLDKVRAANPYPEAPATFCPD